MSGVDGISAATRNFCILDAAQFVVLLPQIGLEDLCRCQEAENRDIPFRGAADFFFREDRHRTGQHTGAESAHPSCRESSAQEETAVTNIFRLLCIVSHKTLFPRRSSIRLYDRLFRVTNWARDAQAWDNPVSKGWRM